MKTITDAKGILREECGYDNIEDMEMDDDITVDEALFAMMRFAEQCCEEKGNEIIHCIKQAGIASVDTPDTRWIIEILLKQVGEIFLTNKE
jgi:hypothetical protein